MRSVVCLVTALAGVLAIASTASAQCADGRIITEESAGRCCWPGQAWNEVAARCEGPPNCPGGWAGEGDTCIRDAVPAAPVVYAAPTMPVMPIERAEPEMIEGTEPLVGLAVAGGITLGVGALYSIIVGSIYLNDYCGTNSWSMYIPLVGGFVWAGIDYGCGYSSSIGDALGIPGSSVQVIGLTLLLIGVIARQPVSRPRSSAHMPELASGPGDVGVALRWDL